MSTATQQFVDRNATANRDTLSWVGPATSSPFTLAQELEPFGTWTGGSIWVPPKDSSANMAKSMLMRFGLFASKSECWSGIVDQHRSDFTQVREIELCKASIRLPKGRLFVSVTERERFDEITDPIPNCVRTRLEEFLDGPGQVHGVKVFYLKPLCFEVDDDLIFTTHESVVEAICQIQDEVFSEYRQMYLYRRPLQWMLSAIDLGLSMPRQVLTDLANRRQKAIDAFQARLEFKRRKMALRAANAHRKLRTDGCTFEEMLSLTNPLERNDVIEQFGIDRNMSRAKRDRMKRASIQGIPWFVAFSIGMAYWASFSLTVAPPLMVCDPVFVAEMPGSKGVVLKIGHFDQVRGVTHVEI